MKKNWKALTAVGAVILIVAVAAILINLRPSPAPEPKPGALQATGKFGFPVSDIKIGEGGTKKASDGKTITGYNGTCDSAVQAAANYAPLLMDLNVNTWAEQKNTLIEVSKPGPWIEKATFKNNFLAESKDKVPGAFEGGWYYRYDVAAGGMYRVPSCDEKKSAIVQVFVGALGANVKTAPSGFFQTLTVELSWSGDWKLSDAAVVQKDQNFAGRVKDGGPMSVGTDIGDGPIPALNAELVNAFFSDKSRQGWIEYANAKR